MEQKQQLAIILWTKRFFGAAAFVVWGYIIYSVMQTPAPFMEQAPYCIAGTMLTFGILTGIFKGLEKWEIYINGKQEL